MKKLLFPLLAALALLLCACQGPEGEVSPSLSPAPSPSASVQPSPAVDLPEFVAQFAFTRIGVLSTASGELVEQPYPLDDEARSAIQSLLAMDRWVETEVPEQGLEVEYTLYDGQCNTLAVSRKSDRYLILAKTADGAESWLYAAPLEALEPFQGYMDDLTFSAVSWTFDSASGTLTFSGAGPLAQREAESAEAISYDWYGLGGQVTSIVVEEGITRIPNFAFYGFEGVTEVSLPSTLKSIGDRAFSRCAFSEITIPTALDTLGTGAFSHCQALRTCDLFYSEVTLLPAALFEGCTGLQYVSLPNGALLLEEACLYGCDQISSLLLPASVTRVEELYADIEVFVFQGQPPELPWDEDTGACLLFRGDVTVYYPEGSQAWTELAAQYVQEGVTWVEGIPEDGA